MDWEAQSGQYLASEVGCYNNEIFIGIYVNSNMEVCRRTSAVKVGSLEAQNSAAKTDSLVPQNSTAKTDL